MSQLIRNSVLSPKVAIREQKTYWSRLYGSAKSLAVIKVACQIDSPVVLITNNVLSAANLVSELENFSEDLAVVPIKYLPDWETLPYDIFSPYQDIISERLQTLHELKNFSKGILVVTISSLMHYLLPREHLLLNSFSLDLGQKINLEDFKKDLCQQGYNFVTQVSEHGEVSIKGSLIDIYPMGNNKPIRIDLFDNEIDSIRLFDVESQRSCETIDSFRVLPAREISLTDDSIARFRQNWRAHFSGNPNQSPIYRDVSQSLSPGGIEYYLPLFYKETSTLFDYINDDSVLIYDDDVNISADKFWEDVMARYQHIKEEDERPVLAPEKLFLDLDSLKKFSNRFNQIIISNLIDKPQSNVIQFNSNMPIGMAIDGRAKDPLKLVNSFLDEFEGRVLIAAETKGRLETILELFKGKISLSRIDCWSSFLESKINFAITVMPIENGLIINNPNIAVITESQLFGERAMQRRLRKRKKVDADTVIRNLTELREGAPVVHEQHGVGRYCGLITIKMSGILGEFIHLEYADKAKLYVPVSALDLISRYTGIDPDNAPLHSLGSGHWQKAKRRAVEKAYDVAAELLELHARRAAKKREPYKFDQNEYFSFIQNFPFEETLGQQEAITSMIDDLVSSNPMDRLVCGDAGFGKTEVAMRAAFIAVQNGKQVALLVPTTLLAQQHYQNFVDRFADWPIKIELLSRFRNKKDQDVVLSNMSSGIADIVIGTHKLLQDDIFFKNLGLIIIDEEHRYGVRQKEKFKSLRAEIDILTLTATPIPRTLNMALSDIRELSIISTPPSRRLAVKTFVCQHDDSLIKEAIIREIKRGGQIFYLHNNVKTIKETVRRMSKLVPEVRVQYAHGKMPEKQLESVMLDFYHRRFNLLVCTTIIETGIDIPTANTIIIDRADKFGLAQLYQLRGRVGRSHHRAYAYLIVPEKKNMTADAIKRLKAIEALEELGVGFTLATHDLEIRGAGEILGEGQSGHIQEIGFSLYMQLLDRVMRAMKDNRQLDLTQAFNSSVEIDLHIPALIPESFLPDVHMRLILYKRIANTKHIPELVDLKEEIIDRFGMLPESVINLFDIAKLKQKASNLGIRKIDLGENGGRICFKENSNVDSKRIIELIKSSPENYKFEGHDKLKINKIFSDKLSKINFLEQFFNEIILSDAA